MSAQHHFAAALLQPDRAPPPGLRNPDGALASKRFDVYRNNVAVSLAEALETAFPVTRKLVGDGFFRAMAGVFLRAHPPRSPLMMLYGAELPGFIARFEPAASLPYLPDIARLEQALRESYHAADARPLDPARLASLAPEALSALRLRPAPATRLIRSAYPVLGIWAANTGSASAPLTGAQAALVTRVGYDPAPHLLTGAEAAFVDALFAGAPLAEAAEAGGGDLDLSAALQTLFTTRALTEGDAP